MCVRPFRTNSLSQPLTPLHSLYDLSQTSPSVITPNMIPTYMTFPCSVLRSRFWDLIRT